MANIAIYELRPAGSDLFSDSESYLQELTDTELDANKGGISLFLAGVAVGIVISIIIYQ